MTLADAISAAKRPDWLRRGGPILLSVLFHTTLIVMMAMGLLGRVDPVTIPATEPPIFVELELRPLLEGEIARVAAPSILEQITDPRPLTTQSQNPVLPSQKLDDEDDQPTTPAARLSAAPALASGGETAPAPSADNRWQYRPETTAGAIARATRTGAGGCRIMDGRLSAGEQALCDERFNAAAAAAPPIGARSQRPGETRRDAEFAQQGAANRARLDQRYSPASGGVGIIGSNGDCPGSNLGLGCAHQNLKPALREDETEILRERQRRNPGQ